MSEIKHNGMTEQEMQAWHPGALLILDCGCWMDYSAWELLPDTEDEDEYKANRYQRYWLWAHDKLKRKDGAYLEIPGLDTAPPSEAESHEAHLAAYCDAALRLKVDSLAKAIEKQGDVLISTQKQVMGFADKLMGLQMDLDNHLLQSAPPTPEPEWEECGWRDAEEWDVRRDDGRWCNDWTSMTTDSPLPLDPECDYSFRKRAIVSKS